MAEIQGRQANISPDVYEWADLGSEDVGSPLAWSNKPDKTVHVEGETVNLTIKGSSNGEDWVTLTDVDGNDLIFDAAGMAVIRENPVYIRPEGEADKVTITGAK